MVSMGSYPNGMVDFQAYAGPGDRNLRSSEVEGYQPVSRIGEVVMNSFVDAYEFTTLKGAITSEEMNGTLAAAPGARAQDMIEHKPMFHEYAPHQLDAAPCALHSEAHRASCALSGGPPSSRG